MQTRHTGSTESQRVKSVGDRLTVLIVNVQRVERLYGNAISAVRSFGVGLVTVQSAGSEGGKLS